MDKDCAAYWAWQRQYAQDSAARSVTSRRNEAATYGSVMVWDMHAKLRHHTRQRCPAQLGQFGEGSEAGGLECFELVCPCCQGLRLRFGSIGDFSLGNERLSSGFRCLRQQLRDALEQGCFIGTQA